MISKAKLLAFAFIGALIADAANATERMVVVVLSEQRAYAIENGFEVFSAQASTGRSTHKTPTGTFKATKVRRVKWVSSRYPKRKDGTQGGAVMPWAWQFNGNIFMHAGDVSKPYRSHGCVRVHGDYAEAFYRFAKAGTTVVVMP